MTAAKSLEELRAESRTLDYFTKFMFITPAVETKTAQKKILRYFFDFIGMEGQDLKEKFNDFCENGIQDSGWAEDKVYQYLIELVRLSKLPKNNPTRIAPGTIKNRKMVLRKLLKVAKIPFEWELVNRTLPKVTKNQSKDRAYTLEEIVTMCKYPDRRIKPIVYTAAAAGLRIGAWNYLKVKHVKSILDKENNQVICAQIEVYEDEEEGEEYTYRTLITKEAYEMLQEWIQFRKNSGENVTEESWLMRDLWDTKAGFTHGKVREPKQLKSSGVKSLIDSALRRTGLRVNLPEGKKRHEVMLTHGFKKWRETALVKTGMPEININTLMGHGNLGMIDYYNRPDLIEEFMKAEKYLIIDETNRDLDEWKEEVKQEVSKEMKGDYEQLKKEFLLMRFESSRLRLMDNYSYQMRIKADELASKNNGILDHVIPGKVVEPREQLDYFFQTDEGKRLRPEEKEILEGMVKNGEIQAGAILSIDPDEYNKTEDERKYEAEHEVYDENGVPFFRL